MPMIIKINKFKHKNKLTGGIVVITLQEHFLRSLFKAFVN